MKTANIAELKSHLSEYISCVEAGESVQICKRNIAVAVLVPARQPVRQNKTALGRGKSTVQVLGDLTEPALPPESWNMMRGVL